MAPYFYALDHIGIGHDLGFPSIKNVHTNQGRFAMFCVTARVLEKSLFLYHSVVQDSIRYRFPGIILAIEGLADHVEVRLLAHLLS